VDGFTLFGQSHCFALSAIAAAAATSSLLVRKNPERSEWLSRGLATSLLLAVGGFIALDRLDGKPWTSVAPLQLCDVATAIAAGALVWRGQRLFELCYFWGLSGTLAALLTPDLAENFPHFRFAFYFAQHGLIVVAACTLCFGYRMRPRRKGALFAWLALNAYALGVAGINQLLGSNFLYLSRKPSNATAFDLLGPWPVYLFACEGLALLLFFLLALPLRRLPASNSKACP
jgi:hypothetical integral membrane protein (TIGR02206 family)